jgi:hypothetical protein
LPINAAADLGVNGKSLEEVLAEVLCERFGGVTAYPATGTFARASGVIQTEAVVVLERYCERDAWATNRKGVENLACDLASMLKQESIGLSVDGKMLLVGGNSERRSGCSGAGGLRDHLRSSLEGETL